MFNPNLYASMQCADFSLYADFVFQSKDESLDHPEK